MAAVTTTRYHYGADYLEKLVLRDGSRVVLRLIRADDKRALADAFATLSPDSRYHRFMSLRPTLSDDDLRFYTEVDGYDHFCIAALGVDTDGTAHGVGTARFVRDATERGVAEPALTVVDAWQNRGLGKELLIRLMWAATEREVRVFRSTVLASNEPMRRLIHGLAPGATVKPQGALLVCEFRLPPPPPPPPAFVEPEVRPQDQGLLDAMRRFLRLAAREFRP